MNVTLVQMRIDALSRAANLARVVRLLDRACDNDPSPDLIVLPEACDVGRADVELREVTPAMADGFGQSIALKAREWGVYIVAGFHRFVADRPVGATVLFDPDGDAIASCWRKAPPDPGEEGLFPVCFVSTSLGVLAIAVGSARWNVDSQQELPAQAARLLAVPALQRETGADSVAVCCSDIAAHLGAHACRAVGVLGGSSPNKEAESAFWNEKGETVARCAAGQESLVRTVVPVAAG